MTDFLQDQAALYALGVLDPEEARALEQHMASDPALATLVRELQDTLAETTRALPGEAPPAEVRSRVLDQIRERKGLSKAKANPMRATGTSLWGRLGWGLAAAFAVSAAWLFTERTRLEDSLEVIAANEAAAREQTAIAQADAQHLQGEAQRFQTDAQRLQANLTTTETRLTQLSAELQTLQQRNALAQMQIATLQSTVDEYKQGVAVVVWDSEKHQGILKLDKMPPVAPDKDYQLWVVDPAKPKPINAGVIKMDANGFARIDFKPVVDVTEAAKFAVSVERKGGVPENEGPIVFIGP
jgi:anti-sigma-K factor RskA